MLQKIAKPLAILKICFSAGYRFKVLGIDQSDIEPDRAMLKAIVGGESDPTILAETKWTSLLPFTRVADLLKEVLPVVDSVNQETVREHLELWDALKLYVRAHPEFDVQKI